MMLIVAIAIMKIYKPSLMPKIKGVQEHAIKETDKELIKLIFNEKFTSTMLFTFLCSDIRNNTKDAQVLITILGLLTAFIKAYLKQQ